MSSRQQRLGIPEVRQMSDRHQSKMHRWRSTAWMAFGTNHESYKTGRSNRPRRFRPGAVMSDMDGQRYQNPQQVFEVVTAGLLMAPKNAATILMNAASCQELPSSRSLMLIPSAHGDFHPWSSTSCWQPFGWLLIEWWPRRDNDEKCQSCAAETCP